MRHQASESMKWQLLLCQKYPVCLLDATPSPVEMLVLRNFVKVLAQWLLHHILIKLTSNSESQNVMNWFKLSTIFPLELSKINWQNPKYLQSVAIFAITFSMVEWLQSIVLIAIPETWKIYISKYSSFFVLINILRNRKRYKYSSSMKIQLLNNITTIREKYFITKLPLFSKFFTA